MESSCYAIMAGDFLVTPEDVDEQLLMADITSMVSLPVISVVI